MTECGATHYREGCDSKRLSSIGERPVDTAIRVIERSGRAGQRLKRQAAPMRRGTRGGAFRLGRMSLSGTVGQSGTA